MQTPQATTSLPTFPKGVHCAKVLRPLTRTLRFDTLLDRVYIVCGSYSCVIEALGQLNLQQSEWEPNG